MTRYGFCFGILGLLFLTNPLTRIIARGGARTVEGIALTGFATPVTMVLMVGVVLGIAELLRTRAALIGAVLAIAGWTAGCRIMALGQLESLLQTGLTGVAPDTLDRMFTAAPIVWVSIVPVGILFPIGLLTLGVTWLLNAPVNRWIGALLIVGGILFPLGRAVRLEWAIGSCDVVLGATFILLGWQVLARHELWAVRPT